MEVQSGQDQPIQPSKPVDKPEPGARAKPEVAKPKQEPETYPEIPHPEPGPRESVQPKPHATRRPEEPAKPKSEVQPTRPDHVPEPIVSEPESLVSETESESQGTKPAKILAKPEPLKGKPAPEHPKPKPGRSAQPEPEPVSQQTRQVTDSGEPDLSQKRPEHVRTITSKQTKVTRKVNTATLLQKKLHYTKITDL